MNGRILIVRSIDQTVGSTNIPNFTKNKSDFPEKALALTDIETWKSSPTWFLENLPIRIPWARSWGCTTHECRYGVQHSEFNASNSDTVHFLQIWLLPNRSGHTPGYEERNFAGKRHNTLRLLVSGDASADALHINSDIQLFGSELDVGQSLTHDFSTDRHGWVQLIKGSLTISDGSLTHTLSAGDGLGVSEVSQVTMSADSECEFFLFDLP